MALQFQDKDEGDDVEKEVKENGQVEGETAIKSKKRKKSVSDENGIVVEKSPAEKEKKKKLSTSENGEVDKSAVKEKKKKKLSSGESDSQDRMKHKKVHKKHRSSVEEFTSPSVSSTVRQPSGTRVRTVGYIHDHNLLYRPLLAFVGYFHLCLKLI